MFSTCPLCVAWQTDGATPLYIASEKGLAECVLALLDGGGAINHAKVGSTSLMARHGGGCVCWDVWEPWCM